jgi:hypothetical protein
VVDGPAGKPEKDRLCDVLGIGHAAGYSVSSLEDTRLVGAKNILKFCG